MRAAASLAVVVCLAACGSGTHPVPTSAPPATSLTGVPALTSGPPSAYGRVTVAAASREADVPHDLLGSLAPLLMARDLGTSPLSDYGLDHPQATIRYEVAGRVVAVIRVGNADFDRRGFYAMRDGDRRVFLVLSDAIRPVLALVGISVPAPTD